MCVFASFRPWLATACLAVTAATVWGDEPVAKLPVDPMDPPVLTTLPLTPESPKSGDRTTIPEPVSLAVFGTGLLLLLRRRRF